MIIMDITREYMDMCLAAEPDLRPLYNFKKGDWIFSLYTHPEREIKILSDHVIYMARNNGYYSLGFPESLKPSLLTDEAEICKEMTSRIDRVDFKTMPEKAWIRLHRLDQLYEMLDRSTVDRCYCPFCLLDALKSFSMSGNPGVELYKSMESLWLKFLMWNNYHKQWDSVRVRWTNE